jgi:uncharacterized protein
MNLPLHRLSHERFIALAADSSGSETVRDLAAVQYSKHVTLLWGVVTASAGRADYPLVRAGFDVLAAAWRENRVAAERVIRYPSVGAWARRAILACRGGSAAPRAEPAMLGAIGAAAAIRAGLRAEIEVPVADGRIVLPTLGAALLTNRSAVIRSTPDGAEAGQVALPRDPHRDAPGWRGVHRFQVGPLDVLIDDLDPFRMPGVPDLASPTDTEPWDTTLRAAWVLLERHHPDVAAEVAAAVSVIVPCSRPRSGEVSTTSPETFGAIGMSLPPDPVTCAVTLAHEVQHLKLGALLDIVTLTLPDNGRRYYAPWRDDPRPLTGLLQGTYAFLGVSGFWRRQRKLAASPQRADLEFARWRAATTVAVQTLRSSEGLTPAGLEFVSGMARTLDAWREEPVPAEATALARHAAESHLARWQSANRRVPVG